MSTAALVILLLVSPSAVDGETAPAISVQLCNVRTEVCCPIGGNVEDYIAANQDDWEACGLQLPPLPQREVERP